MKALALKKNEPLSMDIIAGLVINGDCSKMSPDQKIQYMQYRCEKLSLDLAEKPFEYIRLNGKEVLYATKACTDALCRVRKITREVKSRERIDDTYLVVVRATDESGRYDESIGVVSIAGLKSDGLANAIMKAETKAKRRAVLSLCGLGMLDESELETIPEDKKKWPVRSAPHWSELKATVHEPEKIEAKKSQAEIENDDLPEWSSTSTDPKVPEIEKVVEKLWFPEFAIQYSALLSNYNGVDISTLSHEDLDAIYSHVVNLISISKKEESKEDLMVVKKKLESLIGDK